MNSVNVDLHGMVSNNMVSRWDYHGERLGLCDNSLDAIMIVRSYGLWFGCEIIIIV